MTDLRFLEKLITKNLNIWIIIHSCNIQKRPKNNLKLKNKISRPAISEGVDGSVSRVSRLGQTGRSVRSDGSARSVV
ncbi:hypothetical protein BpHYR1_027843 [Brachionus plicatilis]|uniref:Uncharacterized protein n=1 Tax=Brachionus plicatilis TaxID=10195 RepID=A0A3M7RYL1_BRAPC|nr:hypothetical protein BpHYR1_027843 [Brachionus plicatilis]